MSYYTEFQVNEATLQASSTSTGATLSSSDSLLVYVNSINHPMQTPIASVEALAQLTVATSGTTATLIPPYGITKITAASSFAFTLQDPPPLSGTSSLYKTIINTTSTSTATTVTFNTATAISTTGSANSVITFSAAGAYVELQSASTSSWLVVGRSAAGTAV